MTKHTPTPWRVEPWNYENGKRTVLTIQTETDAIAQVLDLWCPDERKAEAEANAALIVRAANSHAELMAALGTALSLITKHGLAVTLAHAEGDETLREDWERLLTARAVYAKASA